MKKKDEKDMQRHQINVRLTQKEKDNLVELSKKNKISQSEVLRKAYQKELAKIDSQKVQSLTQDEKEKILKSVASMNENVINFERVLKNNGNNINQIAKKLNSGVQVSSVDLEYLNGQYKKNILALERNLAKFTERVDSLLRILV